MGNARSTACYIYTAYFCHTDHTGIFSIGRIRRTLQGRQKLRLRYRLPSAYAQTGSKKITSADFFWHRMTPICSEIVTSATVKSQAFPDRNTGYRCGKFPILKGDKIRKGQLFGIHNRLKNQPVPGIVDNT